MESSTEILRHMLDERGVEWEAFDDFEQTTQWSTHNGAFVYWARERDGELLVETTAPTKCSASCTPAQAIAATLGRGECRNISEVMDEHGQARFACSECHAWIDSRLLWNPEYRNGESPWVSDCKLNFCPNCGRRIVDPTANDADAGVTNG